jgi:phosphohistidine phosphatase SixA
MGDDTRTTFVPPYEAPHPVKQLELRRHARRDPAADRLSPEGRAQAEDLGRRMADVEYGAVLVSPAQRAAETAAWFLRGAGRPLPEHSVIPGLGGDDPTHGSAEGMAAGVRALLEGLHEGSRGLAFSHTPFVERAALGLTGRTIEPLSECEGILITQHDDGRIEIEELRNR